MERKRTPKDIGLMYGFRSGLEEQVAHQLQTARMAATTKEWSYVQTA